jgi:hypothetical protein
MKEERRRKVSAIGLGLFTVFFFYCGIVRLRRWNSDSLIDLYNVVEFSPFEILLLTIGAGFGWWITASVLAAK